MVIVRLLGGLGNQLFQYATGRALALRQNTELKLDLESYAHNPLRAYRLDRFNIAALPATKQEVAKLTRAGVPRFRRLLHSRLERCLPRYARAVFHERAFSFDPELLKVTRDVYLDGYWQSEKYFREIAPLLRQELTMRTPPNLWNQEIARKIDQSDSISLHVRRGDYVSNATYAKVHGLLPLHYYHSAITELTRHINSPHIFVFSDDFEWVHSALHLDHPVTFVEKNGAELDYEDLRLMSRCKHHIIANSTFSWWAAWLSDSLHKIVLAPKHWFNASGRDTGDLLPQEWTRV